jgi:hypothetical protein
MKIADSMNVYALPGFKVIVTEGSALCGSDLDRDRMSTHLGLGGVYTVDHTKVDRNHTSVWIVEFPGVEFNSSNFVDFSSPQSDEEDARHPDWARYR